MVEMVTRGPCVGRRREPRYQYLCRMLTYSIRWRVLGQGGSAFDALRQKKAAKKHEAAGAIPFLMLRARGVTLRADWVTLRAR